MLPPIAICVWVRLCVSRTRQRAQTAEREREKRHGRGAGAGRAGRCSTASLTGAQVGELGFGDSSIHKRAAASRRALHPGVYVVGADTWHQRMLGACMAAGGLAVASHRSAAPIWGFSVRRMMFLS